MGNALTFVQLVQDRLSVSVPLSFWRWTLGGEITVPTLDGGTQVSLSTRPSDMVVKGQGWPEPRAPHRQKPLFVLPRIVYPAQHGAHERELLQMLDNNDKLPEVEGWNRHVKAWLEASAAAAQS
jgi:DnaJ-class molecular chaperone